MYKYSGKVIRVGRSWTNNDGITHPSNWGNWTAEEKESAGLTWEDDPQSFDNRFYWAYNVPKNLEDVNEVDEDGNPLLDNDGVQVVTKGLKSNAVSVVKAQAAGLLASSDWMVVKASEVADYSVPSDILAYRAAVRAASNDIEASIMACSNLEAFMGLYETPVDDDGNPTGNAVIVDFPKEVS